MQRAPCEMCESASIIGIKPSEKGLQLAMAPLSETLSDFQKVTNSTNGDGHANILSADLLLVCI